MGNWESDNVLVTTDARAFVQSLRAGDVLIFDTLIWLSNLIKFADNAPANHCAVVLSEGRLADAGENTQNHPRDTAVTIFGLHDYLAHSPRTHTVRALRPRAFDPSQVPDLEASVNRFVSPKHEFAVMDMIWLAPSALRRSYEEQLRQGGEPGPGMTDTFLRWLHRTLLAAAKLAHGRVQANEFALTCSEFVYRALTRAGLELQIESPLTLAPPADGYAGPWSAEEVDEEAELIAGLRDRNARIDPELAQQTLSPAGVEADRVTPGDLFRSPSLDPVAVLLKPGPPPY